MYTIGIYTYAIDPDNYTVMPSDARIVSECDDGVEISIPLGTTSQQSI